jgi:peptidoglycan/xylan/chitin deacetylase (PgdA/CDA1 family)
MTIHEKSSMEGPDKGASKTGFGKPSRSKNYMLFRKSVRWMVVSVMYYSGAVFLRNLFKARSRARILVYHSISNDPLNPFSVSPEDFEEQVRFLSREYNVISLEELVACIRNEQKEIPTDSVVVTLDDGFRDNYIHAYPILKKYGVPATIFVITDRLESDGAPRPESGAQASGSYLSWDQVVEMSKIGISIGSHTLTHACLTGVTLEKARREIVESKACLEQRLGKPVRLFAYPGGRVCDFNQDIKEIVTESGYSCVCTGLNGTNGCGTAPYLLRRTKIEVDDGMYVFKKAMKGALDIFVLLDHARRFSS